MPDPASPPPPRPAALSWSLLVTGLALCAAITWLGPAWVGSLEITPDRAVLAALFAAIFLPMLVVAFGFAAIERFSAFSIGRSPVRWALIGLAAGMGGLAIAAGYSALADVLIVGSGGSGAVDGLALGVAMILFQTGSEEIFFRGWVQTVIERQWGVTAAIGLTSLLFAAFHAFGAPSVMGLVNLCLGGVVFGLLKWRSDGLVAPVLAHFGWNAAEQLIVGLYPNPGTGSFGALLDWDLAGPPIWGGGQEGLNSSVGMLIVLVALILPLAWPFFNGPARRAPRRSGRAAG